MKITITNDAGEVYAVHDIAQQAAACLGHRLKPETMPPPDPGSEPEPDDADEVINDMVIACRREIVDPVHGETTPYENGEPAWCRTMRGRV